MLHISESLGFLPLYHWKTNLFFSLQKNNISDCLISIMGDFFAKKVCYAHRSVLISSNDIYCANYFYTLKKNDSLV